MTQNPMLHHKLARPKGILYNLYNSAYRPFAFRLHVYRSFKTEVCEGIRGGAQYILSNIKHIDMQSVFKS